MEHVPIESIVQQFAWLLLGAAIVGMVAQRIGVSYPVALVLIGLAIEEADVFSVPHLSPGLLLFALLPPLLFDASFRLDARELRLVLRPVLLLAVPGVLIAAALVGGALALLLDLPLGVALLFGSIVAATDPVAVVGVVQKLGLPARLTVIAEAESLINDGMAITVYTAVIGYAVAGHVDAVDVVRVFGQEVLGGLLIGGAVGLVGARLTRLVDDHLVEMTLSTVLAYGSYLLADSAHASGPLACVATGLIHGSYGRAFGMSRQTSEVLDELWEYLGFLANAIVFLLVGFTVDLGGLLDEAWPVAAAIVAVLATRAAVVWLMTPRAGNHDVPAWKERLVLTWAGLRGALTIALALALPADTPHRTQVIAMAFGVVLFTLVVQGLSLPALLRRLGFGRQDRVAARSPTRLPAR
jgi:monovalent cation:H+ antiporter, CPA1 family